MSRLSARLLLEAAVQAAEQASEHDESSVSRGCDLGYLNEQWAQTYIGFRLNDELRKLYDPRELYVTFETNVDFVEDCVDRGRGRPAGKLTSRQRFDLLLWSRSSEVLALVEIKDQPSMRAANCLSDPRKLESALRRWSALRFALFIFSVRSNQREPSKLAERLTRKRDEICDAVVADLRHSSVTLAERFKTNGYKAWSGMLIRLAS